MLLLLLRSAKVCDNEQQKQKQDKETQYECYSIN